MIVEIIICSCVLRKLTRLRLKIIENRLRTTSIYNDCLNFLSIIHLSIESYVLHIVCYKMK